MRLNELKDNPGSRKFRVRVGRGIGSGMGKQAGRGGKGQTARSGVRIGGFEGGQMPLHRRLPKRGFNKRNRKEWNEINLGRLQEAVDAGRLDAQAAHRRRGTGRGGAGAAAAGRCSAAGRGRAEGLRSSSPSITPPRRPRRRWRRPAARVTLIEKKVLAADEAKRKKVCRQEGRNRQAEGSGERGISGAC